MTLILGSTAGCSYVGASKPAPTGIAVSVTEVAHAGEHHGDAGFISCCNHFRITHRAAWLDHAREVLLSDGKRLGYDWLILATGARHSYFGRDDWAPFAPGIKTIDDATAVRRKVLLALERAETETDKAKRDALLTFVIIGGGPTGVEMAGAVAELARKSVSRDFRHITPHCSKIILVDGHERVLSGFPESLSARARASLEELGVELQLNRRVENVDADGVIAGGGFIPAATAIWAAGVQASPAAEWLGIEGDRAGRVPVDAHLRPAGHGMSYG